MDVISLANTCGKFRQIFRDHRWSILLGMEFGASEKLYGRFSRATESQQALLDEAFQDLSRDVKVPHVRRKMSMASHIKYGSWLYYLMLDQILLERVCRVRKEFKQHGEISISLEASYCINSFYDRSPSSHPSHNQLDQIYQRLAVQSPSVKHEINTVFKSIVWKACYDMCLTDAWVGKMFSKKIQTFDQDHIGDMSQIRLDFGYLKSYIACFTALRILRRAICVLPEAVSDIRIIFQYEVTPTL